MWGTFFIIFIPLVAGYGFGNQTIDTEDVVKFLKSISYEDVSKECTESLEEYMQGISTYQPWALEMFDSITKFPDGVLMGHVHIPGHFDECVQAVHTDGLFRGKHCMVSLKIEIPVFEQLLKKKDSPSLMFFYGLCVPSTCTSSDVKAVLKQVENVSGDLKESDCSTNEFRPLRTEDFVTISVIGIIVAIAVGSTYYDLVQRKKYKNKNPNQLLSSFSLYTNTKLLFKISQSTAQLKCLHGIRFLSISWVVLGHAYFNILFSAPMNFRDVGPIIKDKSFIPISNAFVSVDSFFFLSGLLVCLVFFRDISKKGSFDVPVAFIHRYLRLTPPFALLILIQATIISRIGNGPFWNTRMDETEKGCRQSWWTGILYVQNYAKPNAMCLGQSWYLSADMQMYWLSPLILYPILWYPAFAPFLILILVLAAALTNFAIGFVNDLKPNFSVDLGPSTMKQFELEYSPFHTRMAPWLIGLGTGYIICGLQAKKIRFNLPKYMVVIGWLASMSLLGGSLFGIARFLGASYTTTESALYLSFHRVGWALGLSWVVIACVAGSGGPINDFLSLDFFQPLAKLSYCNFLIHMTVQSYRINTSRINQYIRHFDIVYSYFGDILVSNLIAIPVVLLFEYPFTHIDRHFFQKLVIFPYPKARNKFRKTEEGVSKEKKEDKQEGTMEDVETGKVNEGFNES